MWTGWWDQADEGVFVSIDDPEKKLNESDLSNIWYPSEPNGGTKENCVYIYEKFVDVPCEARKCGICDIAAAPVLSIRGRCQDSKFDSQYSWTGELSVGGKYNFVGFSNSFLFWDDKNNWWKLQNNNDDSVYAISNETGSLYPLGTHFWYFFNDSCTNEVDMVAPFIYKSKISFTSCKEDKFNCLDGTWYVHY